MRKFTDGPLAGWQLVLPVSVWAGLRLWINRLSRMLVSIKANTCLDRCDPRSTFASVLCCQCLSKTSLSCRWRALLRVARERSLLEKCMGLFHSWKRDFWRRRRESFASLFHIVPSRERKWLPPLCHWLHYTVCGDQVNGTFSIFFSIR